MKTRTEWVYTPEIYTNPSAIDTNPSKECRKYHENSCIQINIDDQTIVKKINYENRF
jgi:hypothetical protein